MTTTSQVRAIGTRLRAAMRAVKDNGWTLAPGSYVSDGRKTCCALGALLIVSGRVEQAKEFGFCMVAADVLGVEWEEAHCLAAGFDGTKLEHLVSSPLGALGRRLAKEFVHDQ